MKSYLSVQHCKLLGNIYNFYMASKQRLVGRAKACCCLFTFAIKLFFIFYSEYCVKLRNCIANRRVFNVGT